MNKFNPPLEESGSQPVPHLSPEREAESTSEINSSVLASQADSLMPSSVSSDSLVGTESRERQQAFSDRIRKRNFFDALAYIVEELVNLEILTVVEDEGDAITEDLSNYKGLPGKRIITQIGLIDGDIHNFIGNRFVENQNYQDVRKFHLEQVNQSQEIITKNLECLQKIINYLKELKNEGN